MIAFIRGALAEKNLSPASAVIETCGVGYELLIPLSTYDELPREGEECKLLVHEYIREDAHTLFGFATAGERNLFMLLITVNGVGPKVALAALSGMQPAALKRAIAEGDVKALARISGIGKRTAERIAVELKGKIDPIDAAAAPDGAQAGSAALPQACADAVLALVSLGQTQENAEKAVRAAAASAPENATAGEIIRLALSGKHLN